jgi:hypothetical protein
VIEPAPARRHHALVLAVGSLAGNQLDHRFADVIERKLAPVVLLLAAERDAEATFPQPPARLRVFHDHAYVLYPLDLHFRFTRFSLSVTGTFKV